MINAILSPVGQSDDEWFEWSRFKHGSKRGFTNEFCQQPPSIVYAHA